MLWKNREAQTREKPSSTWRAGELRPTPPGVPEEPVPRRCGPGAQGWFPFYTRVVTVARAGLQTPRVAVGSRSFKQVFRPYTCYLYEALLSGEWACVFTETGHGAEHKARKALFAIRVFVLFAQLFFTQVNRPRASFPCQGLAWLRKFSSPRMKQAAWTTGPGCGRRDRPSQQPDSISLQLTLRFVGPIRLILAGGPPPESFRGITLPLPCVVRGEGVPASLSRT